MNDRIDQFQKLRKRKSKKGTAWAALEARLTLEEVCEVLQEENREAMRIAVEAWGKLLEVRHALIAMRGNLNHGALEQIIMDIGTIVSPFPGVNLETDE